MKQNYFGLQFVPNASQLQSVRKKIQQEILPPQTQSEYESDVPGLRKLTKSELQDLIARLQASNTAAKLITQTKSSLDSVANIGQSKQHKSRRADEHHIENRLLEQGRQREERLKQIRQQRKQEQIATLRQYPEISKSYNVLQKPLSDRYQMQVRKKEIHLEDIKQKYEPKFQPSINLHSQFIAQIANQNDPNVINRLTKRTPSQPKPKDQPENLFHPAINEKSRKMAMKHSNHNWTQRMSALSKQQPKDSHQQISECTFQPQICNRSKMLAQRGRSTTQVRRVQDRLFLHSKQAQTRLEAKRVAQAKQFSHQPKINKYIKDRMASREELCSQSVVLNDQQYSSLWGHNPS